MTEYGHKEEEADEGDPLLKDETIHYSLSRSFRNKNFDELLQTLGEFGSYQKRIYFLICLLSVSSGILSLLPMFLLDIPGHRCTIPGYPNDTYAIQNEYHRQLVNATIPTETNSDGDVEYKKCVYYDVNVSDRQGGRRQEKSCSSWVYDKTVYESTFASMLDLVCDDEIWSTNIYMVYFVGTLVGNLLIGAFADRFGLRLTIMLAILATFICSVGIGWSPNIWVHCILGFVVGMASVGTYVTGFVLGIELVGPSKRVWAGIVVALFYAFGLLILAGLAYLIRNWKYLAITCGAPNVLFLSYWWLLPESPRWLLDKGRSEEAKTIITKAAKVNKVDVKTLDLDNLKAESEESKGKIWDLFTSRVMLVRSLVIFFNWMVSSIAYYGLSLNSENLAGDFYLNFFLVSLVEFPAYTTCLVLLDRLGRKTLHSSCMILCGICSLSAIFSILYLSKDYQWVTIVLALIGKAGAAAVYAIVYVWTAELFPTVVRNIGIGTSSFCANVGGAISPYIADISRFFDGDIGEALPLMFFGGLSLLAGLLSLTLPETLGLDLPDTIKEAERFGRRRTNIRDRKKNNTFKDKQSSTTAF